MFLHHRSPGFPGGRLLAWLAGVLLLAPVLRGAADEPRVVMNAGLSGHTTRDLLARVDADVLAHAPDLVVMMVGTNDQLNSRKAVPLAEYAENLGALVRQIKSTGARTLLVTIPPAYGPYVVARHGAEFFGSEGPRERIVAVNEVVRRVAREQGVPVVDFFAAVERAGGATERADSLIRNEANSGQADGVHPTAEGYRLLGRLVAEALAREDLRGGRRIVCFGDSITRGVHLAGEGTAEGDTYPAVLRRTLGDWLPANGAN